MDMELQASDPYVSAKAAFRAGFLQYQPFGIESEDWTAWKLDQEPGWCYPPECYRWNPKARKLDTARPAPLTIVPTLPLNLTPQDILDAREMFDDEVLAQESDRTREVAPA